MNDKRDVSCSVILLNDTFEIDMLLIDFKNISPDSFEDRFFIISRFSTLKLFNDTYLELKNKKKEK